MKKIYLVLTHTGTILSEIIRNYTKDEFSHVSISLDEDLQEMYSFGRINAYNPFWGNFVHEYINKGTFKRFKNTKTEIYSLLITDAQYEKINKTITYFGTNKDKYKFNIAGLFCVSINKKITRKNTFYCAEFIKHVLKTAGINKANELPSIIRPQSFKNIPGLKLEYKGLLRKYKKSNYIDIQNLIKPKKIGYV